MFLSAPTLCEVANWLTEHSGLSFSVPDADYLDRPIPHFTHSGTGYLLLDNLGKAFGITDYFWYQLPDGAVYVGGAEKALFAGRPIDIPHEFNQGVAGGNSMTLPLVQSLRPGVELNGERVTKVHPQNDTMAVTWTPRNRATGKPLQKTPVQRQIESHYPELASGVHLPKFGRVSIRPGHGSGMIVALSSYFAIRLCSFSSWIVIGVAITSTRG